MRRIRWLTLIAALALLTTACDGAEPADTSSTTPTAARSTSSTATTTSTLTPPTTETVTATATPAPPEGGTLVIGTTETIASLDGSDASGIHDWEILKNIGEPLLRWAPASSEVLLPAAAADFGIYGDDGMTYTIRLRPFARFGDGTPVTATDYATQINDRLLDLEGPGGVGSLLGDPYITGVEAIDETAIRFNLTRPWGAFERVLTSAAYIPLNPTQFGEDLNSLPEVPIYGNGPWYIESYEPGVQTTLERNPNYDGPFPARLDSVIVFSFPSSRELADAVAEGTVDIAWRTLDPESIRRLETTDGLTVARIDAGPLRSLVLNHSVPPMDDPNVRRALAYAVDRAAISEMVYSGTVEPLYSVVPPGILGANDAFGDRFMAPDPGRAAGALSASGYTSTNPLELEIWFPPDQYGESIVDVMMLIEEQLEATSAIEVELMSETWQTYVDTVVSEDVYPAALLGWFYEYPDPDNYLSPFILGRGLGSNVTTGPPDETTAAQTEQLTTLLAEAAETRNPAIRETLYQEIQALYAELVVTIPLWIESQYVVYRDNVSADPPFISPETLNIGATIEFFYSELSLS